MLSLPAQELILNTVLHQDEVDEGLRLTKHLKLAKLQSARDLHSPQVSMSVGMFPDGSNPEGIDPSPAVPWNSKADLMNRNVYVYGSTRSAPSNKLCTVLLANDIPFQRVDCSAPAPGSVGRFYRKIPIIVVGERQVNDSGIILKNLIPALAQSSPQMEYNAGWDQRITYELDPTIRNVIQRSDGSRLGGCCMGKSVVDHMNREAKKAVNPGGAFKAEVESYICDEMLMWK
ncbi:hypothetical protein CYMTET_7729 [Cymbomonas tetramitiformis]|uniref:Uncharacterized protein n=1 Tax=Cymbomonas tetramitiformis TaxID=36881 RepID=A0AAE0LGS6_9CHLO|nr:hypothetical protein CYMTET_7729 [Cymbomonas tetramitiformis]